MYKVDAGGQIIDCDSWSNFFQSACWNPTAATVQVTQTTVANTDGTTSTVLAPATPANTDVSAPSALCNFLDCDSSGNLVLDSSNLAWAGGIAFGLFLLLRKIL